MPNRGAFGVGLVLDGAGPVETRHLSNFPPLGLCLRLRPAQREPGENRLGRSDMPSNDTAKLLNLFGGAAPARPKPATQLEVEEVEARDPRSNIPGGLVQDTIQTSGARSHGSPNRSAKRRRISSGSDSARIPYARRSIPQAQKRLLDKRESWFPSLPGQTFPAPNVPIDLLRAWERDHRQKSDARPVQLQDEPCTGTYRRPDENTVQNNLTRD